MPKVCIDPGHGGYDPGAVGNSLQEKDVVLDIALSLRTMLAVNGVETVMTRVGDYAPANLEGDLNGELQARVSIANASGADLFVSVHVNSATDINVGTGAEILIIGTGGKAETAAKKVLPYLVQAGAWANRGVKTQNVLVLRETSMPAILTESGFINTAADAAKLAGADFRKALAIAHAKGICEYFGIPYKEEAGEEKRMKTAVVYYTANDFSVAKLIADQLGGCGMFCRNGSQFVHEDALGADHMIVVGGPKIAHKNATYLAGNAAVDTAEKVVEYVRSL